MGADRRHALQRALAVFPGIDEGAVGHFLAGKDIGDMEKEYPAPLGDHTGLLDGLTERLIEYFEQQPDFTAAAG
ncbi:MAG: hypothetical protein MK005_11430 [Alcanivorax sp.]|nr:hypothetical protein [Alcanivorax sp.]